MPIVLSCMAGIVTGDRNWTWQNSVDAILGLQKVIRYFIAIPVNIMSLHCSRKRMRSELQRWRALMITKVHLADIWLRPDGIGHPLAESDHRSQSPPTSESVTLHSPTRGEGWLPCGVPRGPSKWHGFFRAGSGLFSRCIGVYLGLVLGLV